MNPRKILISTLIALAVGVSPAFAEHPNSPYCPAPATVSTKDIGVGIQKHIDDQSKAEKDGKFHVKDSNKDLAVILVKIHDDKLANLGNGSYFACVDLKDMD